jgi:hypothetical protein
VPLIAQGTQTVVPRKSRLLVIAVLLSVMSVTLTACDNNVFRGPLALRDSGDGLEIAVCSTVRVSSVRASFDPLNQIKRNWQLFWEASGEADLVSGTVVKPVEGLSGLDSVATAVPDLIPEGELDITFEGAVAQGSERASAVFVIPHEGIPATGWLRPDGDVYEVPCA